MPGLLSWNALGTNDDDLWFSQHFKEADDHGGGDHGVVDHAGDNHGDDDHGDVDHSSDDHDGADQASDEQSGEDEQYILLQPSLPLSIKST